MKPCNEHSDTLTGTERASRTPVTADSALWGLHTQAIDERGVPQTFLAEDLEEARIPAGEVSDAVDSAMTVAQDLADRLGILIALLEGRVVE